MPRSPSAVLALPLIALAALPSLRAAQEPGGFTVPITTYVQKVMEVKPTDVQGMAETYLVPAKMTIVVVGDKAKIGSQIAPYE
jgi:hypothetical protein